VTPSDSELIAVLPGATAVHRHPYRFATSCPLTELHVSYGDRASRMLLKELGARPSGPDSTADPRREIGVYRDVLAPAGIGPALHAYGADWIIVELVDGIELWQVDAVEGWEAVASWLGHHHRRFVGRTAELHAAGLFVLDASVLLSWVDRAAPYLRGWLDPAACRASLAELSAAAPTLVHGEFYPSNILIAGDRVVPVDWETAAIGPGVIDLAALITGWDDGVQKRLIEAYGDVDTVALDRARLALALRWIGWKPGWAPPVEHRHDWRGEAIVLAERLGR
jgi:Phosphotransferase enzyme family